MGINLKGVGNFLLDSVVPGGLISRAMGGERTDLLPAIGLTAAGFASGNPALISAGFSSGASSIGARQQRNAEQAEYDTTQEQERFAYDDKVRRYEAAWDTYERNLAMVRRHLDENPELKASAPKEYLDALNVKRTPAPAFRFQQFKPRSSSPLMGFLSGGASTMAQLWPQPNRNQLPRVPDQAPAPKPPGPFLGGYSY